MLGDRKRKTVAYLHIGADIMSLGSERPVEYNLEEIEEATNNFDETRRIGIGGYGSVFFGMLGKKVCKPHLIDSLMVSNNKKVHPINVQTKNWIMFNYRRLL